MGIDIAKKHVKKRVRTEPASDDVYLGLLHKLYAFLERRTDAPFNAVVLKRLRMSNSNRPSLSLSAVVKAVEARRKAAPKEPAVAVAVATVTDDERMSALPAGVVVAALKFTKSARARILAAGGEALTLDQLAQRAPKGEHCVLLRGRKTAREAQRHFGTPGARGSKTAPFVRSEGRKFERARGKR